MPKEKIEVNISVGLVAIKPRAESLHFNIQKDVRYMALDLQKVECWS